ncbi:hypothetical protein [Candidatus Phyllobacterium onerii]|uniref:hypothetical protein n=1 Tax=Candidatus Phyllobacterium onerii TaxID=3020828 RepID=UPI00232D2BC8|nr:hypothetical protein [Phyllobacterium sp. IY22]
MSFSPRNDEGIDSGLGQGSVQLADREFRDQIDTRFFYPPEDHFRPRIGALPSASCGVGSSAGMNLVKMARAALTATSL